VRSTAALAIAGLLVVCLSGVSRGASQDSGTLTIAVFRAVGDLNPFAYKSIFDAQTMVFDPLVQYGPGGKILPGLARSWDISADRRTVTFHLRPNVRFSDGTPWNAPTALLSLHQWVGNEKVASFLGSAARISSIEATGDLTLVMHLKEPYFPLLQELSLVRPVRFVGQSGFDASGQYQRPIGTGPFKVVSNTDTETVFERNDNYWGPKPKVSRVVLKVIPDAQTRLAAVSSGAVDVIGGDWTAPITPQEATTLKESAGVRLVTAPGTTTLLLAFNYRPGHVTTDSAVRRAVSMAIDRSAVVRNRFLGFAQPAGTLFPLTVPLSDPSATVPTPNLQQARITLEADGWTGSGIRQKAGKPLNLTFLVSEEAQPGSQALAEIVQSELQPVGINVDITTVDHATYHDAVPAGQYDVTLFETIGAPYDPLTTLTNYFQSTVANSEGKIWMNSQGLDPLIEAVLGAQSDEARRAAYRNVYRFLNDQTALVPLAFPVRIWAYGKRVHGMTLPPTDYDFPLGGVWVSGLLPNNSGETIAEMASH
jgi:nickel transport system substrate-binding protein